MGGVAVAWSVFAPTGERLIDWSAWAVADAYHRALCAAGYRVTLARTGRVWE